MSILDEQLIRNQAEAKRLWAQAGDETKSEHERYCCAWGAMDCDLACELLREAMAEIERKAAA